MCSFDQISDFAIANIDKSETYTGYVETQNLPSTETLDIYIYIYMYYDVKYH